MWCGICNRRTQSHWVDGAPYYRCRFPAAYALANRVEHPLNVNLREDAVSGHVDTWLAREFAPHRLSETIRAMAEAQQPDTAHAVGRDDTIQKIAECDQSSRSTAPPWMPGRAPLPSSRRSPRPKPRRPGINWPRARLRLLAHV
jgi:hypothetical protein